MLFNRKQMQSFKMHITNRYCMPNSDFEAYIKIAYRDAIDSH